MNAEVKLGHMLGTPKALRYSFLYDTIQCMTKLSQSINSVGYRKNSENAKDMIMDSQQERLLWWLGGILDGEGSISASYSLVKKEKKHYIHAVVTISMGHKPTMERVYELFRSLGVQVNFTEVFQKGSVKTYWNVRTSGITSVNKFLKIMRPYLFTKTEQADLMIAYTNSRLKRLGKSRISPYAKSELALVDKLRELNTPRRRILRDFTPRLPVYDDQLQDKVQA